MRVSMLLGSNMSVLRLSCAVFYIDDSTWQNLPLLRLAGLLYPVKDCQEILAQQDTPDFALLHHTRTQFRHVRSITCH